MIVIRVRQMFEAVHSIHTLIGDERAAIRQRPGRMPVVIASANRASYG